MRRVFLHGRVERARLAHGGLHRRLVRVARRGVGANAVHRASAAQRALRFLEESSAERAEGDDGVAAGRDLEAPARLRGSSVRQQAIDAEFGAKRRGLARRLRRRPRRRRERRRGRRGKRREEFERGESRMFHRGRRAERPERRPFGAVPEQRRADGGGDDGR